MQKCNLKKVYTAAIQVFENALSCNDGHNEKVNGQTPGVGTDSLTA